MNGKWWGATGVYIQGPPALCRHFRRDRRRVRTEVDGRGSPKHGNPTVFDTIHIPKIYYRNNESIGNDFKKSVLQNCIGALYNYKKGKLDQFTLEILFFFQCKVYTNKFVELQK